MSNLSSKKVVQRSVVGLCSFDIPDIDIKKSIALPKRGIYRNKDWLAVVHEIPCMNCGAHGVHACHSNFSAHGKGKSLKATDASACSLCPACHTLLDQSGLIPKADQMEWFCEKLCLTYKTLQVCNHISGAEFPECESWEELAGKLIEQMESGRIKIFS